MTPAHTDSPLRRSEAFRDGAQNITINDDDEERRQARRRTLLQTPNTTGGSTFEENETLKKCLEIYNGNKLSRDNAWSLSLIDTLSALLDRHHKSLNNFKIAGSSLEASSKVYSLRVDSIHIDVLRLSAGLNAQKFTQRNIQEDEDDDVATGGDEAADPNTSAAGTTVAPEKPAAQKPKPKRQRRVVSTITRNKETLNARLDTVPLQDAVFGKLNSVIGSINSSNRLMNNILVTTDSELRLRTNFGYWQATQLEQCDYTAEDTITNGADTEQAVCDRLFNIRRMEELMLRPLHGGYVISDTPEAIADDKDDPSQHPGMSLNFDNDTHNTFGAFHTANELSVAFDINAECEPMPQLSEQLAIVDVDYGDFDDLTTEERTAINKCRGLRKAPVLLEDLRPVDANSELEYSYRPLDKIGQFWAGPSHWKFKRTRPRQSQSQSLKNLRQSENNAARQLSQRGRRAQQMLSRKRSKQLNFGEFHDDLFIKLDGKCKIRRANFQKKWDPRKLKLPTDLQFDTDMFYKLCFAPGMLLEDELHCATSPDLYNADIEEEQSIDTAQSEPHFAEDAGGDVGSIMNRSASALNVPETNDFDNLAAGDADHIGNETVLEIATDFEGAPSQVTKIIVPFAKRAKVIDMKSLKRCCTHLLSTQMKRPTDESVIPQHPIPKNEKYSPGMASFKKIYEHLPQLLTQNMAEALTPSVAFYSVLHLANDLNLRLIPQEDLDDFKIRQVML